MRLRRYAPLPAPLAREAETDKARKDYQNLSSEQIAMQTTTKVSHRFGLTSSSANFTQQHPFIQRALEWFGTLTIHVTGIFTLYISLYIDPQNHRSDGLVWSGERVANLSETVSAIFSDVTRRAQTNFALGLQPYPQKVVKVVRPPKPTPTTFSGGMWSPRVLKGFDDRRRSGCNRTGLVFFFFSGGGWWTCSDVFGFRVYIYNDALEAFRGIKEIEQYLPVF